LVFDENNKLYIAQGSMTDHGPEFHPYAATILKANDDGTNLSVYATGVRNAYGLEYWPGFGLIATDNGPNMDVANPSPVDEVNLIVQGGDYGYPGIYGNPPVGHPSLGPALSLPAHSAPTDPAFDHQRAWSGFEHDLVVPLFATGAGAVVRVSLFKHPITGKVDSWFHGIAGGFSNVISCDFSPAGAVMAADFTTALIYKIQPEDSARIRFHAQPRIGTFIPVSIEAPDWPSHHYYFLMANANLPGYVLPNSEVLFLDVNSPLFNYISQPGNIIDQFPFPGTLNGHGQGNGYVFLPNFAPFIGYTIWSAFVTFDGSLNIGSVSESVPLRILAP
ncbi:MAG: PQQ-dependent sugar dehydrogenase, partial [Salinibacterium sp.]|nr:PQQ-dependent sugar dehydrogenase [Salinibacterium sp.]